MNNYVKLTTVFKQDSDNIKNCYVLYNKKYFIENIISMERQSSIKYQSSKSDNIDKYITVIQFLTGLYCNVQETPEQIIELLNA